MSPLPPSLIRLQADLLFFQFLNFGTEQIRKNEVSGNLSRGFTRMTCLFALPLNISLLSGKKCIAASPIGCLFVRSNMALHNYLTQKIRDNSF